MYLFIASCQRLEVGMAWLSQPASTYVSALVLKLVNHKLTASTGVSFSGCVLECGTSGRFFSRSGTAVGLNKQALGGISHKQSSNYCS